MPAFAAGRAGFSGVDPAHPRNVGNFVGAASVGCGLQRTTWDRHKEKAPGGPTNRRALPVNRAGY